MTAEFGVRLRVIALAAALALPAAPALAQSSSPAPAGAPGLPPTAAPGMAVAKPRPPAPNPLTMEDVSKIKGTVVYDSNDKKVGSVSTILMKPENKTIDRLVVGEGGVLGIGSHYVALPVSDFSWDSQKEGFKIAKTTEELKAMPAWQEQQVSEAPAETSTPMPAAGAGTTAPTAYPAAPAQKAPAQ